MNIENYFLIIYYLIIMRKKPRFTLTSQGTPKQSIRYSYTITLKPRYYVNVACDQFDYTGHILRTILRSMFANFTLVAEITQNMNVHYHGTITLPVDCPNVRKKFIDTFRKTKEFGFVCIKDIIDEPGWIDYISKSLEDSKRDIERRPILQDDFNYFDEKQRADYAEQW